jgi:selenocysteine-specific elongation factor
VNLVGVAPTQIERGNVLTMPGWLIPTERIDTKLNILGEARFPLKHGAEVSFFCGAMETTAKVHLLEGGEIKPGGNAWVQLTLDTPLSVIKGDRFIIRSPMDTLGGGTVVISHAQRYRRQKAIIVKTLEVIESGGIDNIILAMLETNQPGDLSKLTVQCNLTTAESKSAVNRLAEQGKILAMNQGGQELLMTMPGWENLVKKAQAAVAGYHRKFTTRNGMPRSELGSKLGLAANSVILHKLFEDGMLIEDGAFVRLSAYQVKLTSQQQERIKIFLNSLEQNPYSPPGDIRLETDLLKLLVNQGRVVDVGEGVVFSRVAYDTMTDKILAHGREKGKITLAEVRDMFNSSRKYVLPLLEYMDGKKLTKRVGNERVVR